MRRKRNGAAKAYALAAPCFGRGADGLFISAPCFLAFPLCVLPGKLPHKSGDVGSSPCAGTRPQFYRLGETSFLAALPPCQSYRHSGYPRRSANRPFHCAHEYENYKHCILPAHSRGNSDYSVKPDYGTVTKRKLTT